MKIAELIQPDINKQLDALYQSFLDLDEHEQIVLKILAVVYKPIGIKKLELLTNCLVDIGLLSESVPHTGNHRVDSICCL